MAKNSNAALIRRRSRNNSVTSKKRSISSSRTPHPQSIIQLCGVQMIIVKLKGEQHTFIVTALFGI